MNLKFIPVITQDPMIFNSFFNLFNITQEEIYKPYYFDNATLSKEYLEVKKYDIIFMDWILRTGDDHKAFKTDETKNMTIQRNQVVKGLIEK